ncbi:hypothetical protein HMPREF9946_02182 [Acetobacteraceae bacterium AT-5844]|nr:hypothetical protein HMPREF9946_02182 [Acetobacteraceae bacterium AT-5844]
MPALHADKPQDGIWSFDLIAKKPDGIVNMALTHQAGVAVFHFPQSAKGLKVGDETFMFS